MVDEAKARGEITHFLQQWSKGHGDSLNQLMEQIYTELHQAAKYWLRGNPLRESLPPTALVSELYLRLNGLKNADFQNRQQFFAFAGMVMRQISVDAARARAAQKRGGQHQAVAVEYLENLPSPTLAHEKVAAIHEALCAFEVIEPRKAKAIELRYFGGFSVEEIAIALDVSAITIRRDLAVAKVWLARHVGESHSREILPEQDAS